LCLLRPCVLLRAVSVRALPSVARNVVEQSGAVAAAGRGLAPSFVEPGEVVVDPELGHDRVVDRKTSRFALPQQLADRVDLGVGAGIREVVPACSPLERLRPRLTLGQISFEPLTEKRM